MSREFNIADALQELMPVGSEWEVRGNVYDGITWHKPKAVPIGDGAEDGNEPLPTDFDDGTKIPTEEEINNKIKELETKWAEQEYARNRAADYPDTGAQFNKIYDDGVTKWKSEMVDPVKAKWPKDNSGPME